VEGQKEEAEPPAAFRKGPIQIAETKERTWGGFAQSETPLPGPNVKRAQGREKKWRRKGAPTWIEGNPPSHHKDPTYEYV